MRRLEYRRLVTQEFARYMYISKALGQLEKDGFVFAYGTGAGYLAWPPEYLEAVITHYYTEMSVHEGWEYEAYEGTLASARLTPEENQKLKNVSMDLTARLAARYNRGKQDENKS